MQLTAQKSVAQNRPHDRDLNLWLQGVLGYVPQPSVVPALQEDAHQTAACGQEKQRWSSLELRGSHRSDLATEVL